MTIYFTSDLHFNHNNIMKFCPDTRPYTDKHEMNEALIRRWNQVVTPKDHVYFLGDFNFKMNETETARILKRLNGNIFWILGNHDPYEKNPKFREQVDSAANVIEVRDYYEFKYQGLTYVLCHYPLWTWNKCHHGAIMLHGHCHGDVPYVPGESRIMDVGWDGHGNGDFLELDQIHEQMTDIVSFANHHK